MKIYFIKLLAICAFCLLLLTISFAQDSKQDNKKTSTVKDTYVISAKAGGVNFVSGKVAVVRPKGNSGYLNKGDAVNVGDKVLTGGSGKAEILLNPGSFVRLAGNSEFEFITTDLDDLQVKVNTGSAIFEVITDSKFRIVVNTPKSSFFIVKSGIYRVDTMADGTAKIEVWKGKAQIGEGKGTMTVLKGGQSTVVNSAQVAVAKFDRDEKDEFELWSKDRAKELDKINAKLQSREMNQALLSSFSGGSWSTSNSFGLWVRDPFSRSYCFLPFGYGWRSPYGHSFDRSLSNYQSATNAAYANNPNWNPPGGQQSNPSYQGNQPGNGNGYPGQPSVNPPINSAPQRMIDSTPSIIQRKSDSDIRLPDVKDQ